MMSTEAVGLGRFQEAFAHALLASDAQTLSPLAAQPGFAVYRNTVMKGCIDALEANYPSVRRLVGTEWFRAAARVYAGDRLPASPLLLEYGADFDRFLTAFGPAAELPYLPGVARLDRAWTEAHSAADEESLDPAFLPRLDAAVVGGLQLRPHVSARWAYFADAPVATIWRRNRYGSTGDLSDLEWRSDGVLIVRRRGEVEALDLDRAGCAFLDACANGETLAEAAARSLQVDRGVEISALLAQLLSAGAFKTGTI